MWNQSVCIFEEIRILRTNRRVRPSSSELFKYKRTQLPLPAPHTEERPNFRHKLAQFPTCLTLLRPGKDLQVSYS